MKPNNATIPRPSLEYRRRLSTISPHLLNIRIHRLQALLSIILINHIVFIFHESWCFQQIASNSNPHIVTGARSSDDNPYRYYSNNSTHDESVASGAPQSSIGTDRVKIGPIGQYQQPPKQVHPSANDRLISSQLYVKAHQINQYDNKLESNKTNRHNRDSDSFSEGSGYGPIPSRHQSVKFDDTEEGDDDEDEDDYDSLDGEKGSLDSGSGYGSLPPPTKKPQHEHNQSNNQLMRPSTAGEDAYLPFRPATQSKVSTTFAPIAKPLTTPPTMEPAVTHNLLPSPNNSFSRNDQINSPHPSQNITVLEKVKNSSEAAHPSVSKSASSSYDSITRGPKPDVPSLTTINSASIAPTGQPRHPSNILSNSNSGQSRHKFSNDSTLFPARNSSKMSDNDYDYDYDNDDEDSVDVANFEDNDTLLPEIASTPNTTNTQPVPYIPQRPTTLPSTTVRVTQVVITTVAPTTTVLPSIKLPAPDPTTPSAPLHITKNPPSTEAPPSTALPENSQDYNGVFGDDDEDDEEEEDETGEEFDGGDEDEKVAKLPSPTAKYPSTNKPEQTLVPNPRWTQTRPSSPPDLDFMQKQQQSDRSIPTNTLPNYPSQTKVTTQPSSTNIVTTSYSPISSAPPSSTTTTTTTTTSTMAPTTEPITITTPTLLFPTRSTSAPFYVSTTMRIATIRYATTPRSRLTTPSTQPPVTSLYDAPDGDIELTRQIYDKAVEMYQATNKAIHSAVEAVWPSSFEVNPSVLEPLTSQPFLFMFVLGGAIIGLVLTMMLVVYIISYRMEPKDDVSIYSNS